MSKAQSSLSAVLPVKWPGLAAGGGGRGAGAGIRLKVTRTTFAPVSSYRARARSLAGSTPLRELPAVRGNRGQTHPGALAETGAARPQAVEAARAAHEPALPRDRDRRRGLGDGRRRGDDAD